MKYFVKLSLIIIMFSLLSACSEASKYKEVHAENGIVSIPASSVSDGNAHYFSFESEGRSVKFFIIKSSDGIIRAAFDACDVCYPQKKGYSQDGEFMVCNNCGQRFHNGRINEVKGGCNPSPLTRTVKNGTLNINAKDIAAGAVYF